MLSKKHFLKAQKVWAHIPLIGPLANCTADNHKVAIKEFSVTFIFATATFWLGALFLKPLSINAQTPYLDLLVSTVESGELFIFSVAFLGPILLTAAEDPRDAKQFPGRLWHFMALVFLAVVAAGFYSQMKIAQTQEVNQLFDICFLFNSSIFVAATTIALRYLSIVYRKQTFNPETELKIGQEGFLQNFVARHGGEQQ